jgi:serine/threonine protein kinase
MRFHEDFEEYDSIFLVCEFCNGGNLENYIENRKSIDINECLRIIYEIGIGISFLHKNNITHRDLKGDNILIHNGKFKIADFGFSHDQNVMESQLGTPLYMAPEIIDDKRNKYTNKVDIWALGIILYNLLTNHYPFYDERRMQLYNKIKAKPFKIEKKYKSKWDKKLQNLLEKCFEKKPEFRLTIEEFLDDPVFAHLKSKYDKVINKIDSDVLTFGKDKKEVYLRIYIMRPNCQI